MPAVAPRGPAVLADDQELEAADRPRQPDAFLGLEHVARLGEGVGVHRTARRSRSRRRPARPARRSGDRRCASTTGPPIRNPRCELPLVATDRSLTSMYTSGSDDSESAQGAAIPIVPSIAPRVRRSPPTLSITPVTPGTSAIAASQARSTMKPLAMPLRLSGQSESRSAVPSHWIDPPGGRVHQRLRASPLLHTRQSVLPGTGGPEPGEGLDPRIERPAGPRPPGVGRLQDLEELRRDLGEAPDSRLPSAELARRIIAAEDRTQAIDPPEHQVLRPRAAASSTARTRSSSDVPITFS